MLALSSLVPFFELPQNPPITSLQQKGNYGQQGLQEQFSVDAKNSQQSNGGG
jgi:hypothetical protein